MDEQLKKFWDLLGDEGYHPCFEAFEDLDAATREQLACMLAKIKEL